MSDILIGFKYRSESLESAILDVVDEQTALREANHLATSLGNSFEIIGFDSFEEKFKFPFTADSEAANIKKVQIIKPSPEGTGYFFTAEGFAKNSGTVSLSKLKEIFIYCNFHEFSSLTCVFKKLELPTKKTTTSNPEQNQNIDPRGIIRDTTGKTILSSQCFWISHTPPIATSEVYESWINEATFKASVLLASELWEENEKVITIHIKGNKTLKIPLSKTPPKQTDSLLRIQSAIEWVYNNPRDVEIRHTLLCQRIANEDFSSSDDWITFISNSIKSALSYAKEDYKNHIHIKTGEILKAITEIRKTVAEEVNKITEKTQSLSNNLLRDASISITLITIRQTLIIKGTLPNTETKFILIINIFWLIVSFWLTLYQNKLNFISQIKFRYNWSRRLTNLISTPEFNKLSKKPYKDAIKSYKKIKTVASAIYTTIIIALLSALVFS